MIDETLADTALAYPKSCQLELEPKGIKLVLYIIICLFIKKKFLNGESYVCVHDESWNVLIQHEQYDILLCII